MAEVIPQWTLVVPSSPAQVPAALRFIADDLVAQDLCLISIYSTGFGEPNEHG